jgi:hypothetical protein
MDSAVDVSCVGKGFHILFYSGEMISLGVSFANLSLRTLQIVTAATVVTDQRISTPTIVIINQAACIPDMDQFESLLHTDQAHHHNVIINDLAYCYFDSYGKSGRQSIKADGSIIPLRHDGIKYFLSIREPTASDWDFCNIIELT